MKQRMEHTDMIFEKAREIISQELSSFTPEFRSNIKAGKRMRGLFLDHSVEGIDNYFTDSISKDITEVI